MTVFTEPDLVRISILGGSRQLDVGLPAAVPIAALIPDVLAALRVPTDTEGASTWTLGRVDGARLAPEDTLAQSGVLDGDLLTVRADRPAARSPLVDDVADGVAAMLARDRAGWSADSSRTVGYAVFLLAAVVAVPVGRWAARDGDRPAVLAVAAVGALLALGVAVSGRRLRVDPRTTTVLTVGGCCLAALAASLAVTGIPGGTQFALAALVAGTCAVIGYRATGRAPAVHAAIATTAVPAMVGGALVSTVSMPPAQAAAVVSALGVVIVLTAPRLAVAAGRLPLPGVPTTPPPMPDPDQRTPVDGVDALPLPDRDPLAAIADLALGDLDMLARRAAVAASMLTGLLAGAVLAVGVSTVIVAASADGSAVALAYCACTVAALSARGRSHTDRRQSAVLVGGAGMIAVAAAVAVLFGDGGPGALSVFLAVAAFGACALLLGTVAAGTDYSPPAVRTAEIVEYAVLVALVPLLLWLLEVYQAVREL